MPFWSPVGQVLKGLRAEDNFGYAVDQSDDGRIIAVGAGRYDEDGEDGLMEDVGQVKVFVRRDYKMFSRWEQMGDDILGEEDEEQGYALKLSANGKTVAIGSSESNDDTGHVKIFTWIARQKKWMQLGDTILGFYYGDGAGWGFDLSEDGRTIAFGVPKYDVYGYDNGATFVYYYDYETKDWELKGDPIPGFHNWKGYYNYTNADTALFGWSVALSASGDRVIMSGIFDQDDFLSWSGAVKVFDYDDGEWEQVGDTLFGDESGDEFGVSVAMSKDGSTIAVGAGCYYYCDYNKENDDHEDYFEDYVSVFRWDEELEEWGKIGHIDRREGDIGFGISVSLSDDGERVGLATAGKDYGYARVFEHYGDEWSQVGQDVVIGGFESGESGHLVSLSGDGTHLLVGSPDAEGDAGQAMAYEIADSEMESPVAGCVDTIGYLKWPKGPKYRSCKFVKKRKAGRCKNKNVASMCPQTCGKCFDYACSDGTLNWRNGKKIQNCAGVSEKPNLMCKGQVAQSTCRQTCYTPMYDTLCFDKE